MEPIARDSQAFPKLGVLLGRNVDLRWNGIDFVAMNKTVLVTKRH